MKKYILIGILVITGALALSAFTLVSGNKSSGSLVGQTQGSAILDKGERDSISFFPETGFRTPPRRSSASPSIAVTGFRTPPMSSYVQSSAVTGVSSGSYLVVVGKYHDDRYSILPSGRSSLGH